MVEEHNLIPTKASLSKGINNVEEVSFVSYKPKVKNTMSEVDTEEKFDKNPIFVLNKAKNEVIKFSMSKLEGKEKNAAKKELLIKLGAKPPRNRCKNYKRLLQEKKIKEIKDKADLELQGLGKNSIGKSTAKIKFDKNRKRNLKPKNKSLLEQYGKVTKVKK